MQISARTKCPHIALRNNSYFKTGNTKVIVFTCTFSILYNSFTWLHLRSHVPSIWVRSLYIYRINDEPVKKWFHLLKYPTFLTPFLRISEFDIMYFTLLINLNVFCWTQCVNLLVLINKWNRYVTLKIFVCLNTFVEHWNQFTVLNWRKWSKMTDNRINVYKSYCVVTINYIISKRLRENSIDI